MPIMAPKVAFPAAFGILIGTCLFKILIPDEEFLILKGELQLYRNHYLYAEVAAHIINTSSACNLVYVKILQTAQVTGRRGVYNMGRNFSIKIVVPIEL